MSIRADITYWDELFVDGGDDPTFYDYLILAEGDSWFSIGGFPPCNLLFPLRFEKHALIVNCGDPGDTIKNMSDIAHNANLKEALAWDGHKWDLILLSGGGNDLIDSAESLLLKKSERKDDPATLEDYYNMEAVQNFTDDVQASYRYIVDYRDGDNSKAHGVPILVHTYDYPTARNAPVRIFGQGVQGPWLYHAFIEAEVPEQHWVAITDDLMNRLAEAIIALSKGENALPNFYVVETRNTLQRAAPCTQRNDHDWLNEIHPNSEGYTKLSKHYNTKIQTLLARSTIGNSELA